MEIATWSPLTLYSWAMLLAGLGGVFRYLDTTKGRKRVSTAVVKFGIHALAGGCIAGIGHENIPWLKGKPATVIFSGAAYALGLNIRKVWAEIFSNPGDP